MNRPGTAIESSQRELGKVNREPALGDRMQPDAHDNESFANKDIRVLPGELTAKVYAPHQHGTAVLGFAHTRREHAQRGCITTRGRMHAQRLMRTLFVVLAAELIEAVLLGATIGGHR